MASEMPGVYRRKIDARSNKVVTTVSTKLDPNKARCRLRKSGKQSELLGRAAGATAAAVAESQTGAQEQQHDEPGKPNGPAEKCGADTAEAAVAEPNNPP